MGKNLSLPIASVQNGDDDAGWNLKMIMVMMMMMMMMGVVSDAALAPVYKSAELLAGAIN